MGISIFQIVALVAVALGFFGWATAPKFRFAYPGSSMLATGIWVFVCLVLAAQGIGLLLMFQLLAEPFLDPEGGTTFDLAMITVTSFFCLLAFTVLLTSNLKVIPALWATLKLNGRDPSGQRLNYLAAIRFTTRGPPSTWSVSKTARATLYAVGPIIAAIVVLVVVSFVHPILGLFAALGAGVWLAAVLWPRAARLRQRSVEEARQLDRRAPVLLLRSFEDDHTILRPSLWSGRAKPADFESLLTGQLWSRGPVIAIGRPGEKVPPTGAARSYYSDDEWQRKAEEMAADAATIVMIIGKTEGLGWEIRRIHDLKMIRKLLLVLPPVDTAEARSRIDDFCAHIQDLSFAAKLAEAPVDQTLMIAFKENNQPVVFAVSDRRDPLAYQVALGAAAQLLPKAVIPPAAAAA